MGEGVENSIVRLGEVCGKEIKRPSKAGCHNVATVLRMSCTGDVLGRQPLRRNRGRRWKDGSNSTLLLLLLQNGDNTEYGVSKHEVKHEVSMRLMIAEGDDLSMVRRLQFRACRRRVPSLLRPRPPSPLFPCTSLFLHKRAPLKRQKRPSFLQSR